MRPRDNDDDDAPEGGEPTREPYEPPRLLWDEEWVPVALAASCGHFPGQSPSCDQVPGT